MGLYDTVLITCPSCEADIEFQSKAGGCDLKLYHMKSVPAEIAQDLAGTCEICPNCQQKVYIKAFIPRVSLEANLSYSESEPNFD